MENRVIADLILDYIRENKFKPYDVEFSSCYFISCKGEDGVVNFKIKGLYGWKFGMWIENDKDQKEIPCVQFFCQHKDNIDKFKPSTSYFIVNYNYDEILSLFLDKQPSFLFYKIISILKTIKSHPFTSYREEKYLMGSNIKYYILNKFYKIEKRIKDKWRDISVKLWHGSKLFFISKYKVVNKIDFIDKNDNDFIVYPRYDTRIHFNKISSDDKIQEKAELKVINFWYHKNCYNNMHIELSRDGLDGTYSYVRGRVKL